MKNIKIKCEHKNYEPAGYPTKDDGVLRVQSIYDVYCNDCNNFISLLSRKIINSNGLQRRLMNNNYA